MKRIFTLLLVLVGAYGAAMAQTIGKEIALVTPEKGYFVIPEAALTDTTIKAVGRPFYNPKKKVRDKKMFELYWHLGCTDGSFSVTVTPKQLFLTDDLGGKHPNSLYWVQNISPAQYAAISESLKTNTPEGFKNLTNKFSKAYVFYDEAYTNSRTAALEKLPEEEYDTFLQNCDSINYEQIAKSYSLLNSLISNGSGKVAVPTKEELAQVEPKFYSSNMIDLFSWIRAEEGDSKQ